MKSGDIIKVENLKSDDDTYVIRWNITKLCNYYCDFCIQGSKKLHLEESKNESKELRKEICDKLIDFIENKIDKKYSHLKIDLIGGEVTILPDFYDILKRIVECKYSGKMEIKLKTNLSFDNNLVKKIKSLFRTNNRKIIISATYYKKFTTEKNFIKKVKLFHRDKNYLFEYTSSYKKNIKKMIQDFLILIKLKNVQANTSTTINYPLIQDKDYFDYLNFRKKYQKYADRILFLSIRDYKEEISNELKERIANVDNKKDIKVTLKDKQILYFPNTSRIEYLIDTKHFDPYGYICDAGIHNICIDNKGKVTRCPRDQGNSITKAKLDLLDNTIICPYHDCHCFYYRTIKKRGVKV